MIKILTVGFYYTKESTGGAAKSFLNIVENLKSVKEFDVESFTLKNKRRRLNPFGIVLYLYFPKILRKVNKFKPHIIITQTGAAFSSILTSRIKKIPIINIIRDTHLICPKYVDIIEYGVSCKALIDKKTCYKCINYWRSLRILIGNRPNNWQKSYKAIISTISYKIRYFICKINIFIFNQSTLNLVASNIMKSFLSNQIDPKKLKIINITPIKRKELKHTLEKKNQLIFLVPSYNASHKGLDFVLKLSKKIPDNYKILIVGNKLTKKVLAKGNESKIINLGHVKQEILDELYKESIITLVPSFYNEAFGRIIIESLLNGTQVISSPNCGANSFFKSEKFLQQHPLKLKSWINAIKEMTSNPYRITEEEVISIYDKFSMEKSKNDFKNLIKGLIT
jgi:glycosyltransferase involved in cell wall biosynthesis